MAIIAECVVAPQRRLIDESKVEVPFSAVHLTPKSSVQVVWDVTGLGAGVGVATGLFSAFVSDGLNNFNALSVTEIEPSTL